MPLKVKYEYCGLKVECDPETAERIHDLVRSQLAIDEPKATEPVRWVNICWSDEFMPERPGHSRTYWLVYGAVFAVLSCIWIAILYAGILKWNEWLSASFG